MPIETDPPKRKPLFMLSREEMEELADYLAHDSWRCRHYQDCHCGLDEITDKIGLDRIPIPIRERG
jgi:hypothetical protein